MISRIQKKLLMSILLLFGFTTTCFSLPDGSMINPVGDPAWNEVLPIRIANVTIMDGSGYSTPDPPTTPICICPAPPPIFYRYGVPISFYEPARVAEVTKDAYYFPTWGFDIGSGTTGTEALGAATTNSAEGHQNSFYQGHWFIFPIWSVLELLTDLGCVEQSGIDLAFMTEILPTWQDDSLAALLSPEVVLFANPIAQMACIADAVAVNIHAPLDPLFWCVGSGGSSYPLNGHVSDMNNIQTGETVANRLIYNMGRLFLLMDTGVWYCQAVATPIWIKSNYKLQRLRPTVQKIAWPVGTSAWRFQHNGNPPTGSSEASADNFSWLVFRKRICCFL